MTELQAIKQSYIDMLIGKTSDIAFMRQKQLIEKYAVELLKEFLVLHEWEPDDFIEYATRDDVLQGCLAVILKATVFSMVDERRFSERDRYHAMKVCFPEKYLASIEDDTYMLIRDAIEQGSSLPKGILNGDNTQEKRRGALRYILEKLQPQLDPEKPYTEQVYRFFADSAKCNNLLRKLGLFGVIIRLYSEPLDMLHFLLPEKDPNCTNVSKTVYRSNALYALFKYNNRYKIAVIRKL